MEQQREETSAARSQHVVHVMPRDNARAAQLIAGAAARAAASPDAPANGPHLVVIGPTTDDAVAIAAALGDEVPAGTLVPVTSARRGKRLLAHGAAALAGTPKDLVELLEQSALKLTGVRDVVLLWIDELSDGESRSFVESLLAEVPKDAARIATTVALSESVEAVLQGFMWRARRVAHSDPADVAGVPIRYVPVADANRAHALRAILDAYDPATATVVAFSETGVADARRAAKVLGYTTEAPVLRVSGGVPELDAELLVVFDDVPDANALRELSARAANVVALVQPSRLNAFRALAGAAAVPFTFTGAFQAARAAEDVLRDELRGIIQSGVITSQILQLEPLCEEHDAVEVAAAALYLVQRERQKSRRATAAAPPPVAMTTPAAPPTSGFTRIYLNVGERDGARRGDIVGAITGEAGIAGTQIGKIDLRDTHAVVEVAADAAARVIERLSGTSIRGRRVVAREDRERDAGPRTRGGEGRERRGSGGRGTPGGARGRPRGEPREGRGARRGEDRMPRAAREGEEWAERGARLRNARGREEEP